MKATDTFRTPPYRHNCAQAIANRWKCLYDNADIVASYAPYVGGRAPEGYCGALYAAMQAMPHRAQEIKELFVGEVGDAYCRKIKGQTLIPCEACVDTADRILEKMNNGQINTI